VPEHAFLQCSGTFWGVFGTYGASSHIPVTALQDFLNNTTKNWLYPVAPFYSIFFHTNLDIFRVFSTKIAIKN
jgi:hypothetical protein